MELLGVILGLAVSSVTIFLPTTIAFAKKKLNTNAIFSINLFLGWTIIGWIVALTWSLKEDSVDQIGVKFSTKHYSFPLIVLGITLLGFISLSFEDSNVNNSNKIQIEEPVTSTTINKSQESFVLNANKEGKYGTRVFEDGFNYINFNIPKGKYLVKWNKNSIALVGGLNIKENKSHINESGFITYETKRRIEFFKDKSDKEIIINDNEMIRLTANTEFTLTKLN